MRKHRVACGNRLPRWPAHLRHRSSGFTLMEQLVVTVIIGIVMAISAPSWLNLMNVHNLTTAQNQAYQMIRTAQSDSDRTRTEWQVSFRTVIDGVEGATHPVTALPVVWETLSKGVSIDAAETTFSLSNGIYRVQFTPPNGRVNGQLGRLTFVGNSGGRARRCVIMSTLLGAVRKGQNQTTADSGGRFCY